MSLTFRSRRFPWPFLVKSENVKKKLKTLTCFSLGRQLNCNKNHTNEKKNKEKIIQIISHNLSHGAHKVSTIVCTWFSVSLNRKKSYNNYAEAEHEVEIRPFHITRIPIRNAYMHKNTPFFTI